MDIDDAGTVRLVFKKGGIEEFAVADARCGAYFDDSDRVHRLVVRVRTGKDLQRLPRLKEVLEPARPHMEASIIFRTDAPRLVTGFVAQQPQAYDDDLGHLANFYYFEHQGIENVVFSVLESTEEWVRARFSGTTNINGGSRPDADFVCETTFRIDSELRPSVG